MQIQKIGSKTRTYSKRSLHWLRSPRTLQAQTTKKTTKNNQNVNQTPQRPKKNWKNSWVSWSRSKRPIKWNGKLKRDKKIKSLPTKLKKKNDWRGPKNKAVGPLLSELPALQCKFWGKWKMGCSK